MKTETNRCTILKLHLQIYHCIKSLGVELFKIDSSIPPFFWCSCLADCLSNTFFCIAIIDNVNISTMFLPICVLPIAESPLKLILEGDSHLTVFGIYKDFIKGTIQFNPIDIIWVWMALSDTSVTQPPREFFNPSPVLELKRVSIRW